MDSRPAPAHANGAAMAAPAFDGGGPESNGNGAHTAEQHSDGREDAASAAADSSVVAGPPDVTSTTHELGARDEDAAGSSAGRNAADDGAGTESSAPDRSPAIAADVSPFIAARATKADAHSGDVHGVDPATQTAQQPAVAGVPPN